MSKLCCFCDTPIHVVSSGAKKRYVAYDFCARCNRTYTAELGTGWFKEPWFKETVRMSRQLNYRQTKEENLGIMSFDAPELQNVPFSDARIEPIPTAMDLIAEAHKKHPTRGWRFVHALLADAGVKVSRSTVYRKLLVLRGKADLWAGTSFDVEKFTFM